MEQQPPELKRTIIRAGTILSMDDDIGDIPDASVLIESDRILDIGKDVSADDAHVIDASGAVVLPGLIDTHRHLWQSALAGIAADMNFAEYMKDVSGAMAPRARAEDVGIGTLLGACEAIDAGVTTVLDWSHALSTPAHADAAIDALRRSGIRAVFGHGPPGTEPEAWWYKSERPHPRDIVRIAKVLRDDPMISLAMAARGPETSTPEVVRQDWALAAELGIPITVHASMNEAGQIACLHDLQLMRPDTIYAHLCKATDGELDLLAQHGGKASICPIVELSMGMAPLAINRLIERDIEPSLGMDTATVAPPDMFAEMHASLLASRPDAIEGGRKWEGPTVTARDALKFATINGAKVLGMEDRIGSLRPGKQADIIIVRPSWAALDVRADPALGICHCHRSEVETVFVAGRMLKSVGLGVHYSLQRLRASAIATREHLTTFDPR